MKLKKKQKFKPSKSETSFRGKGEDYKGKEKSSDLSSNSVSYKDHYDAA